MMGKEERHDFFEKLYGGEELVFTYKNRTLFVQGYFADGLYHMNFQEWEPNSRIIWETSAERMSDCAETFLDEPLFDNKCFWDIESDISWIDG